MQDTLVVEGRGRVISNILVVDEESGSKPLTERYLESLGHRVRTTPTIIGALGWLDRQDFDFLVIDVVGRASLKALALCRVLKSDPRTSGTKAIIIGAQPDLTKKAKAAGVDAVLARPFQLDDLKEHIECLAKRGRASQPMMYGVTIHGAVKTYTTGTLDWARGRV